MIKKYLHEIEMAGIILLFIGFIVGHLLSMTYGAMFVIIGMALWLLSVVVKALHWNEYRRENMVNIYIMSGAIIIFLITLLLRK